MAVVRLSVCGMVLSVFSGRTWVADPDLPQASGYLGAIQPFTSYKGLI